MTQELTAADLMAVSAVVRSPSCQIVRSLICGKSVQFAITAPKDHIQRSHAAGQFYEPDELAIISNWVNPGDTFCDIGANIGNHTLFALIVLNVGVSIVFEPNPAAIETLRWNILLNGLEDRVDCSCLGLGLSDEAGEGFSINAPARNIGGARLEASGGEIRTISGDQALAGRTVDFLKIDVEGMEMKVLSGLSQTIAAHRPKMFVEVDTANDAAFKDWVQANRYSIVEHFKRYKENQNYLIVPS